MTISNKTTAEKTTPKKLTHAEVLAALVGLSEWNVEADRITRQFVARSTERAASLIVSMAKFAEQKNHHPEVTWLACNLTIVLSTHDVGGLTSLDTDMARWIEGTLSDG